VKGARREEKRREEKKMKHFSRFDITIYTTGSIQSSIPALLQHDNRTSPSRNLHSKACLMDI
jgi:hypothetical protein